ncbi:Toll-interacting protein [Hypsibius exemplaris]|uniref:Toll-interacting protein n=1 Tax=Hypsibius exemplaris TaxID=2072580 RepID=A0A1W0X4M2_HYPEX|nr:Toll-interacting protein [Hypsibius exemplaris]
MPGFVGDFGKIVSMENPQNQNQDRQGGGRTRRQMVMLDIPEDFLRIPMPEGERTHYLIGQDSRVESEGTLGMSQQNVAAAAGGHRVSGVAAYHQGSNIQGKLSVTIAQAKLGKNYGLTRMDPYARIRIGHYVFETDTDTNGATNPRWDKTFTCFVPPGINSVYVEVFDERTFAMDERVAWGHFTIPQRVFEGDALDDWWQLSGKQGEQKEGMIEIVFSYERIQMAPYSGVPRQQVIMNPGYIVQPGMGPIQQMPYAMPTAGPNVIQQITPPPITDEDIKQMKEMFPNVDDEVIRSVLEEKHNNKTAAINGLLSLTEV